jgi:RNA polymerase sigma-70 factor, ECF subfamily
MEMDEIRRLIDRARSGDHAAFEQIVLGWQQEVRVFVAARASAWDLVEEVTQATFVTCYQILDQYQPTGSFAGWLKGIARRKLLEELRARARGAGGARAEIEASVARERLALAAEAPEESDEAERLKRCMAGLTDHARELLRRRYELGVPLARLAQQFKRTQDALAGTLKRVRAALRECMERRQAAGA